MVYGKLYAENYASVEGSSAESADAVPPQYTSCLSDKQAVIDDRLASVCFQVDSPFGRQFEMCHLDGHVTIRCTPGLPRSMIFKGSRGVQGVARLMRELFLDEHCEHREQGSGNFGKVIPLVHMGVVCSCMEKRLQTSQCCYLENRVVEGCGPLRGGWIRVEPRMPDQCNIVRLSVLDWRGILPVDVAPIANDLVITSKGSVVHRLSWGGLPWDARVEAEMLRGCAWVVEAVASVC
jgi:hypothetical protein